MSATALDPGSAAPEFALAPARSPWRDTLRRFGQDRWALAGLVFLLALHLLAMGAPWFVPHVLGQDAFRQHMMDKITVAGRAVDVVSEDGLPIGPSPGFPLGADLSGRDVLSRVIYGARVSLLVSILGTALALALGLVVGLISGFYRGIADTVLSRFVDAMMAIPILLLAIALASVLRGGSVWIVILILDW